MMKNARLFYCGDYGFDCRNYENLLPAERFEKYAGLKPLKAKQNCIGAYLLLRYALKECGITGFELRYSENGKPYVDGGGIFFNLSHADSGFVCAVDYSEIGADIEKIRDFKESLINRVFSPQEKDFALKSENPQRAFTALWTLKESSVKRNAETISQYSKYNFICPSDDFYADRRHYRTFHTDDSVISVCGQFETITFDQLKFTDLL